jgi:hypothetical protein
VRTRSLLLFMRQPSILEALKGWLTMLDNFEISIDQLEVGLYIHLDLKWFEHPFAFSHFKIKNEEQIRTIQGLGLTKVRYDPALSDVVPRPPAAGAPPGGPEKACAKPPR